jgi:hypothetical protein
MASTPSRRPLRQGENLGFSECARYHLAVKPKKGTAVLFHSIKPTGVPVQRHSALEKRNGHVQKHACGLSSCARLIQRVFYSHPQASWSASRCTPRAP